MGEKDKNDNVIRVGLNDQLQATGDTTKDRIVVATQVVEAGVDISARTLITELCPWASIVQRIGRCNRTGDDGPGQVFWIDNSARDADKKEDKAAALPYSVADLLFARRHLEQLEGQSVSPKALDDYKKANEKSDDPFLKFEHRYILRRRDLLDLFDTAPDLSGNDIDVARFVRSDDADTDVQVFWRSEAPSKTWDAAERRRQQVRGRNCAMCRLAVSRRSSSTLGRRRTASIILTVSGGSSPFTMTRNSLRCLLSASYTFRQEASDGPGAHLRPFRQRQSAERHGPRDPRTRPPQPRPRRLVRADRRTPIHPRVAVLLAGGPDEPGGVRHPAARPGRLQGPSRATSRYPQIGLLLLCRGTDRSQVIGV